MNIQRAASCSIYWRTSGNIRVLIVGLMAVVFIGFSCPNGVVGQTLRWQQEPGYRFARLTVPTQGKAGFVLLQPGQTGILFTNQLSYETSEKNQNLLNGAGVAAGDFDGDGLCDLYFCNLEGANGLYRNLGSWRFQDVTKANGVGGEGSSPHGAVFADINGDRHLDLLVSAFSGSNACYLNNGRGQLTNAIQRSGLISKPAGGHSLTLADIDGDGDLDLYVANYGENSILRSGGAISVQTINGKPVVRGRHAYRLKIIDGQLVEYGEPHFLYLNNGQGIFSAASWTDGTFLNEEGQPLAAAPADMGLSAMFRDLNGDRFPDLYVCNDFQTPDRIWINDGHGHFRAIASQAIRSTPHFSMGVDFADIDRDGLDDFFVCDMLSRDHRLRMTQINATNPPVSHVGENIDRQQFRRNGLYWNRGDGTYAEIANYAGVEASDWSWSAVFLDVDLDGYEDLLVANGHAYDTQNLDMHEKHPSVDPLATSAMRVGKDLKDYPPLNTPNVAFRNNGDRTFTELGAQWGFDSLQVSHGIALADFDNDGDLDIAVSCLWKPPLLYRNESTAPRVAVRLRGRPPNTQGVGARISLLGGPMPQSQQMICGGRYLSGDEPIRVFTAGNLTNRLTLEVTWRNGRRSVVTNVQPNCLYEVDEAAAQEPSAPTPAPPANQPLFIDVSASIAHKQVDEAFNDFERQPLLHKQLSTLGPGVAWCDINGDGHEDLIVTTGRGGRLGAYENNGSGGFRQAQDLFGRESATDDLTSAVVWTTGTGQRALLLGLSNYEQPAPNQPTFRRISLQGPALPAPPIPPGKQLRSSTGPVIAADLDGDGDLDIFVGGRVNAGRYPEAATSQIFLNNGSTLTLDSRHEPLLQKVGLVSGAVFSDLDADGFPELILACEWGSIRVFRNKAGLLMEVTAELGLDKFVGWWNGVTTGDLDGDGKLDIIASNWGLNSSYQDPPATPLQIVYGDIDGNGTMDLFEGYIDPTSKKRLPRRDLLLLTTGWPLLRTRFATHKAYAQADLTQIVAKPLPQLPVVQANTLASMCFLNRDSRFEAVPLPVEAQFAPAFGVNVTDFDGDGQEDIFLAQNFFDMRPEEPRLDSGRGLLLRGLGTGRLEPVPGPVSGIIVYGQQRGSATADFDEDGRADLVVAQNRDTTKLFRNQTGRPGLRIRLLGPAGNPSAAGAVIRLRSGDLLGAAREIHAGSGYWSQDSSTQVMAAPKGPLQVAILWPGGKKTTSPVPDGAREITVDTTGAVKLIR